MGRFSLLLLAVLLQGCSATAKYYIPDHGKGTVHQHTEVNCTAPSASYQFNLAEGVNGFVSAEADVNEWWISYGFNLSKGSKLQVIDPTLNVRVVDSGDVLNLRMGDFGFAVYGGLPDRPKGYNKYFASGAELAYTGLNERLDANYLQYDTFRSGVHVSGQPPQQLEVKLPDLLVNGSVVQTDTVRLRYVEQKYWDFCIQ